MRPVWVLLDLAFPPEDETRHRVVDDGLDLTGKARGSQRRNAWLRSRRGMWLGRVTFEVGYVDGRGKFLIFADQLVPARALLPSDDNRSLR